MLIRCCLLFIRVGIIFIPCFFLLLFLFLLLIVPDHLLGLEGTGFIRDVYFLFGLILLRCCLGCLQMLDVHEYQKAVVAYQDHKED